MRRTITTTLEGICCPEKGAIISGPFGSNISSKYFVEKGIPVIRGNNLSLSLDKFYDKGFVFVTEEKADELNCFAEKMDLIFTSAGTIGQVGLIPEISEYEKYVISNKQIRVRVDTSKVDILYVYYWFASPWIQKLLISYNKGSTVPLLSLWEVKNLPITYPQDIEEQHKIATFLEKLTKKIENNRNINNELESMTKTIYDYWFLQFEFPNEKGKPYKSSGGKMVWNEELKREIPEGWGSGTFVSLGEIVAGGTPSTGHPEYYAKEGIAWITPNDLSNSNNKYITHGERDISQVGLENSSARLMPKGSVLLTSRAPIGYIGIAANELCTNQGFKSIIPNEKYGSEFIYYTVEKMVKYLKSLGTGSTFTEISKDVVSKVKIVLPEEFVVKKFEEVITEMSNKRKILEQENKQLIELRDFLLPLLMNGQVGFKD